MRRAHMNNSAHGIASNMVPAFKAGLAIIVVMLMCQRAATAADCKGPPISAASVDTINGPWTCHINDASDKVQMVASAHDYDDNTTEGCDCGEGDRIDLASTVWQVSSGVLDYSTGVANNWMAGTSVGSKTLTVTFKDYADNPDCDDPDVDVTKTLTAFKVGCHLFETSLGQSEMVWEDDTTTTSERQLSGALGKDEDQIHRETTGDTNDGSSSAPTWTLKTSPADTAMKKNIHASGTASVGGTQGTRSSNIRATANDNDWFNNGIANLNISFDPGGYVTITPQSLSTLGDDNAGLSTIGVGFTSQIHTDFQRQSDAVSDGLVTDITWLSTAFVPSNGLMCGANGASKSGELEVKAYLRVLKASGKIAEASAGYWVYYAWGIDPLPYYGD
jgi:hypothetical protein